MNQHALDYLHTIDQRRPKTDRLIIERLLKKAAGLHTLIESEMVEAHKVFVKWADLAASGQLQQMHETQLQGEFITDIFGSALHYTTFQENLGEWEVERECSINGGTPDAVVGKFKAGQPRCPVAVVELKGPTINLDIDRSNGRTAVQQCWDYLNHLPDCRWGIVSNMVCFRLYERNKTPRRYEHFSLEELRDFRTFRQFYVLFERRGLLVPEMSRTKPRAALLLDDTENRQRDISDELYNYYSANRIKLIRHLYDDLNFDLEKSINTAQQLIDRIIFIAFCEDRELMKAKTLLRAYRDIPPFTKVTNPRWQSYLTLFRFVDEGHEVIDVEDGYNGGLFRESAVDDLDLPDEPWTNFFNRIGEYDFRDEVNLDVLGHLFEKSITELEKLRQGDFFSETVRDEKAYAEMPQSAKRKRLGIYYTPPEFTEYITRMTVDDLITERFQSAAIAHGQTSEQAERGEYPDTLEFHTECLMILRNLKVCDPACGSGAFLFQAYSVLEQHYTEIVDHLHRLNHPDADKLAQSISDLILNENIYGVDLSAEAVEITQLALWIKSAHKGKTLADLSHNIIHGNSLVRDTDVDPHAFEWEDRFPEVFNREESGFDCIIGNPPWERMKLQEREFFSLSAPEIATASNAAKRRKLVDKLESRNEELHERYEQALEQSYAMLDYVRQSGEYPLTGKGDINTYAAFAETASRIVAPHGKVGLLVPSGIASDNTTKDFFGAIIDSKRLNCVFDFENRKKLFPDVDGRFKFSIFSFNGKDEKTDRVEFVFFAHEIEDIFEKKRRVRLTASDIRLLNPNTRTCPIFRSQRDAEITKRIYRNVPILIDKNRKTGGNPWGIKFKTMFHQTNDAELFCDVAEMKKKRYRLDGNIWRRGKKAYLPLYEAKMIQMYDHRAASVIVDESNWMRQGQTDATTLVSHQNPEFTTTPRYWVSVDEVDAVVDDDCPDWFIGFKDITSPTNQRTMIAGAVPYCGATNHLILVRNDASPRLEQCLLANMNAISYDYVSRQKIGGITLNFFIVEQLPTFPPDKYKERCPWDKRQTLERWISERVLKLTCTAEDMLPLSEAADFTSGDLKDYNGRLHKWKVQERAEIMAELDAAYFILYGVGGDDVEYILSTFKGIHDSSSMLPGTMTQAERILETYDHFADRC